MVFLQYDEEALFVFFSTIFGKRTDEELASHLAAYFELKLSSETMIGFATELEPLLPPFCRLIELSAQNVLAVVFALAFEGSFTNLWLKFRAAATSETFMFVEEAAKRALSYLLAAIGVATVGWLKETRSAIIAAESRAETAERRYIDIDAYNQKKLILLETKIRELEERQKCDQKFIYLLQEKSRKSDIATDLLVDESRDAIKSMNIMNRENIETNQKLAVCAEDNARIFRKWKTAEKKLDEVKAKTQLLLNDITNKNRGVAELEKDNEQLSSLIDTLEKKKAELEDRLQKELAENNKLRLTLKFKLNRECPATQFTGSATDFITLCTMQVRELYLLYNVLTYCLKHAA